MWAGFSCRLDAAGEAHLLSEPEELFEDSLRKMDLSGVDVAVVMHTTIDVVGPALEAFARRVAGAQWRVSSRGTLDASHLGVRPQLHAGDSGVQRG